MSDTDPAPEGGWPRRMEYMSLDDLVLRMDPRNPKAHDDDGITASLERFGYVEAIALDERTGLLVSGHGRLDNLTAARVRGEVPEGVVVRERDGAWLVPAQRGWHSRDDDEALAYLVASNWLVPAGGWTDDLAPILADLAVTEGGLPPGVSTDDLERLLAELNPQAAEPVPVNPPIADRFIIPPFTVLDGRSGRWQERKRRWLSLGLQGEVGRDGGLAVDSPVGYVPGYYDAKAAAEADQGRALSHAEFQRDHLAPRDTANINASGTSVFDPVLCEIAYRWYCPPGGRVLDPFAGGATRGLVAAALGRKYVGVELRPEQVAANEAQAALLLPHLHGTALPPDDYTPAVTPVERRGDVWAKRDDAWCQGGANGAKSRTMFRLAPGHAGIITAGARTSPQIERAALVAQALGIGCRVHVPAGADTDETATCLAAGAEVVRHTAGRLSVLRARFRDDVAAHPDWLAVPFGMGMDEYVEDVAAQVQDLPADAKRIVVPAGSGSTLAGIIRGLDRLGSNLPVVGVTLGHDPREHLAEYAPGWEARTTLVDSGWAFDTAAPTTDLHGLRLDSYYEAKCLPVLQPDDVLWCVGIRAAEQPRGHSDDVPAPRWVTGDAGEVLAVANPTTAWPYDLLFSCPPYADLEVYSDLPGELSAMDWQDFRAAYYQIIGHAVACLKPDSFAVWVVGEVRDKATGNYRGLVPDTINAFTGAGCAYHNEAVLVTPVGALPVIVGRQFPPARRMVKTHQTVLVFCKGDPRRAAERCGPVDVATAADLLADEEPLDIR